MLKGQYNKFGNVSPGHAVVDRMTGETLFKVAMQREKNAINFDTLVPYNLDVIITVDGQREVTVLSKKMSNLVRGEILNTPGYKDML